MQDSGRPEKSPRPAQSEGLYQSLPDSSGRPALIALNHWRVETWAGICRIFALVVVSAFVVFSIFTYYDRLSQYNTRDQDATLDRINLFLKDRDQPVLNAGSNLSNIIVGFPAKYVRSWLDLHFKEDDHLVGNIYYTRFLPFALVQVTISLLLLSGCVLLLGKLSNWQFKKDYFYYLLSLSVVLNFPMLKGLCKVLKYDCFSLTLGIMALLSYLVAKNQNKFRYFILAIAFSGLAFIEKDTAISVLVFIALAEIILAYFDTDSVLKLSLKLFRSLLVIVTVFCLTVFATVPKIWTHPRELSAIFSSIPSYGISANPGLILAAAGILVLLVVLKKYLFLAVRQIRSYLSVKLSFILLAALFLFALFYQKNDIKWPHSAARTTGLIAGFCLLNLFVYAYLLTPIEAKYLSLVMFGLVFLLTSFLVAITKQLSEKNIFAGSAVAVIIVASLIVPSYQNAPAYFGYMNIFRSRSAEDIRSINVEDYSFWTWMGWGETSYELMKYAGQNSPGKNITVGFDYLPPLHCPRNVTIANTSEIEDFDLSDAAEMDAYFKKVTNAGIDYVIISKNTANRALALNHLLKEKRNKAVHVDRQGGIDYGWLFRPSDLVSTEWRDR